MWCARMQPFYDTCQEFKREALLKLGRSGSVIRGIGRLKPILRYQIVPAFSPSIAYFLSERKEPLNGFRFYGIEGTWRSDLDFVRLNPIMWPPTIELLWVKIHDDFAKQLDETITGIAVKVRVADYLQLDGTGYELAYGVDRASFKWGEQAPPEWAELAGVGKTLASHIDDLLQI